jgi:hypothetical protein
MAAKYLRNDRLNYQSDRLVTEAHARADLGHPRTLYSPEGGVITFGGERVLLQMRLPLGSYDAN